MEIRVKQYSVGSRITYEVFFNNTLVFKTSKPYGAFSKEIILSDINNKNTISASRKFNWFFWAKYVLKKNEKEIGILKTKSFWQMHDQIIVNNDIYDIYGHRGRMTSIYKNGKQIAYFEKEITSQLYFGNNYSIFANNNCDKELIALIMIAHNDFNYKNRKTPTETTQELGKIWFERKSFDKNWSPK